MGRIPPRGLKLKKAITNKEIPLSNTTTVLYGKDDPLAPIPMLQLIGKHYPDVINEGLEGESHQISPKKLQLIIQNWIKTISI